MHPIDIVEVGLRDGLQNEKVFLSLKDKIEMAKRLSQTGIKRIELGSFVSPKMIPQMKDTGELIKEVLKLQTQGEINKDIKFSALVPNLKGLEMAQESGLKEIAIFLACTDKFSQKNINCTVDKSLEIYREVSKKAIDQGLKVRAYLSVCFSCPYEGKTPAQKVLDLCEKIQEFNVYEISVSDTVGLATPLETQSLLEKLSQKIDIQKIALHFHNVHGMALANAFVGYQMGVKTFDGSVGGLGGCPYAGLETGNVPTESLVYMLEGPQSSKLKPLIETAHWLEQKIQKKLPSSLLKSPYYK